MSLWNDYEPDPSEDEGKTCKLCGVSELYRKVMYDTDGYEKYRLYDSETFSPHVCNRVATLDDF